MTTGSAGAVWSTFTVDEAVVMSPARSFAVPVSTSAAPSSMPVDCGGEHVATPDTESVQVNVAVTGELFQFAAFDVGATATVICGGVVSIFRVTVALPPSDPVTSITWVPLVRPAGVKGARYVSLGPPSIEMS